jgi:hypothetical protein
MGMGMVRPIQSLNEKAVGRLGNIPKRIYHMFSIHRFPDGV